jgi:hypothetical protein
LAQNESSFILNSRLTRFPETINDYVLSKQRVTRHFFFQQTFYSLIPLIEKCVQIDSSISVLDSFEIYLCMYRKFVTLSEGFSFLLLVEVPSDRAPDR